ncbi:hypothetical protein KC332_g15555 [Hortaea werneckii]|uniref:RING-type domain-containing protein n=2 Tax=Hortaea werneckii TaxID=91943 RepID=A0A3M7I3Y6_HORWE|nr:hypothetical protein KC358_g14178 [Hortaea werneckii]OTA29482.1 hypothetical protein BTJ68_11788 [Hortaea werneckii EXF-2000]KAI6807162.1 hypothetical protein KC350_g13880 [Hortaea werneckii]KAI6907433.1 hypothetical protein KC348_g14239 [Hortaea werneckii]KAI6924763.1 hypothetical protein KC341_g13843 [Hortaea werneckii]
MDFSLRCNSLKCRTALSDRAVVTTCSHIFCEPCSETLGLANPNGARVCPACETHLANPDDAVVTQLNPTEDYKTSVLSGLSPSIIMECAGRGLAFYSYQTTQEIVYQEFLARSLTDKYSSLSTHLDKVIHDANLEITGLREKLAGMHMEQKALEEKNHQLVEAFREKSKTQQQLQKLYQTLKQQQLAAGMEIAADHDAEHTLNAADVAQRDHRFRQSRAGSRGSGGGLGQSRTVNDFAAHMNSRAQMAPPRNMQVPSTPSGTRQGLPLYGANGSVMSQGQHGGLQQSATYRNTLHDLDPNVYGNSNGAGHGFSAGMKVGRHPNGSVNRSGISSAAGFGRPIVR